VAVVNTKSKWITNADAAPMVPSNFKFAGGFLKAATGVCAVAAADDDTSVYRFVRLPSNCRITSVMVFNDAMTGSTSWDFGVYRTARDGGAVISVALFGSAIDLSAAHAATGPLNVTYEATITDISKREKMLWELMGLATDPGYDVDVCGTANTVGSLAGNVAVDVFYVV
jgi:hypothetical protein